MTTFPSCRAHALLPAALLALSVPAVADDRESSVGAWDWGFSIGLTSWSDIGDVESTAGGDFDSNGLALEMRVHRNVIQLGNADLLIGADLGFFSTDSNILGDFENLVQRGVYLTPSVKLRYGDAGKNHFNLEAGAGWYNTDFAELECDTNLIYPQQSICIEINQPFNENAFGSYVGASAGFGRWFTVGLRTHFVDFGTIDGVPSIADDLKGPVYVLSFGASFGQ